MTKKTFFFFTQYRSKIELVSAKELLLLRELLSKNLNSFPQLAHILTRKAQLNVKRYDTKYMYQNNEVLLLLRYLTSCQILKIDLKLDRHRTFFRTWQYNCKEFLSSSVQQTS